MMDRYQEKTERFFAALARNEYSEVRVAFCEMARECALKYALEAADNPEAGVGQWSGGKISVCREWMDGVESALARAKGEANSDGEAGFAYPPV